MSWHDDEIANKMGYQYCVLFDTARDAITAYHTVVPDKPLGLPENICPELVEHMHNVGQRIVLGKVNPHTGLANGDVHLYGYQAPMGKNGIADLALDPLMTGWVRHLRNTSAVISFGLKKMLNVGYGGAFLTQDAILADQMEHYASWNDDFSDLVRHRLNLLKDRRLERFDTIGLWDRFLGDSLIRIPGEQLMPWRVMRQAHTALVRWSIVKTLRLGGYPVGTNYPPISGMNWWGDTVLNFPVVDLGREEIQQMCDIIRRVVDDS